MMKEELHKNYDLIQDYVDGILDQETHDRIEDLIAKSEEARLIKEGIEELKKRHENQEDIDTYLDNFHDQQQLLINRTLSNETRKSGPLYMKIAASIALMLAIGAVFVSILTEKETWKDYVTQELSTVNEYPVTTRSSDKVTDFDKAVMAYKSGEFRVASDLFHQSIGVDKNVIQSKYFLGLSQVYSGNYEEAITVFNDLLNNPGRYENKIQWYLGLLYLQTEQIDLGKIELQRIADDENHYKAKSAQELLDRITHEAD